MWSLRDEERKRKKKGGVKWELMELYKTDTNMGDLWDHSLLGYASKARYTVKTRNRANGANGLLGMRGWQVIRANRANQRSLSCRSVLMRPPTSQIVMMSKRASVSG